VGVVLVLVVVVNFQEGSADNAWLTILVNNNHSSALPEGHPAGQKAVIQDVTVGLGLGFVIAGAWWLWAKKEFRKMDNFRAAVAEKNKE